MEQQLKSLLDAREILTLAYHQTIGMGPAHDMVWHAVTHIDKQKDPIIHHMLYGEDEVTA
jgi:hypothetical protein